MKKALVNILFFVLEYTALYLVARYLMKCDDQLSFVVAIILTVVYEEAREIKDILRGNE
jgi:hypothetical protein